MLKNDGFNTTALADRQDRLLKQLEQGQRMSTEDYQAILTNPWVKLARKIAPNNLVVRNDVILDVFERYPSRQYDIMAQGSRLSSEWLWIEGYSYWLYVKSALQLYQKAFKVVPIPIEAVDRSFMLTAYRGADTKLWPAPFGDLREISLEDSLQEPKETPPETINRIEIGCVERCSDRYIINPRPVGLNTHCPVHREKWRIHENTIHTEDLRKRYSFYTGYSNKYKNEVQKVLDIMDPRRILSIFIK